MKIFISWSGPTSHFVAKELANWLTLIESSLEPFVSSEGISKGSIWFNQISEHLKDSSLGILVLTPQNIHSPWVNFEAGALFRGLTESRIIPFLVGMNNSGLANEPLAMFQSVTTERAQIFELIEQINNILPQPRTEQQLSKLFDKMWSEFESVLLEANRKLQSETSPLLFEDIITFANSQKDLEADSHGISSVVNVATVLRMSGGTFKTFCDDARNLDAVKQIIDNGGLVRLLMLHPQSEAISMLAKMRKDYSPRTTEEKLRAEIEMSVDRLLDALDNDTVKSIVKLHTVLPRYGLCISEKHAVLTLYLHGHGASSPSFFLRTDIPQTKEFCDRLIHGFDDSWSSTLSQPLDWI